MNGDSATSAAKPPRDVRAKRRRTLLLWGITVIAATIGIVLIAAVGPILREQLKPQVGSTTISPLGQSEVLRTQAEDALRAGETTAALLLARSAAAADPTNAAARDLVTRLSAASSTSTKPTGSSSSSQASSTSASSPAPADAGYIQPVADLAALLPTGLAGYALEPAVITPDSVSVSASPQQTGAETGRFIWTVRDRKKVSRARSFLRKTTKELYGKDRASVTVHGVSAYYGTDGGRIATVTYARGRYVFEVLLSAEAGSAVGTKAAEAFRDAPVQ